MRERWGSPPRRSSTRAYRGGAGRVAAGQHRSIACLHALVSFKPAIERFFTDVLVMAEDPAVRRNRLGLLQSIRELADGIVDLAMDF